MFSQRGCLHGDGEREILAPRRSYKGATFGRVYVQKSRPMWCPCGTNAKRNSWPSLPWLATEQPAAIFVCIVPCTTMVIMMMMTRIIGSEQRRERQNDNRFRSAKQQHCAFSTLFFIFLYRHCTTTTWTCQISRFVEDVITRRRLSFSFPEFRNSLLEFNSKKWPTSDDLIEM